MKRQDEKKDIYTYIYVYTYNIIKNNTRAHMAYVCIRNVK